MASPTATVNRSIMMQIRAFVTKPVVKAAVTSGTVMPAGDTFCQLVIQQRGQPGNPEYDWRQTMRFGVVGLTLHGPFFYNGYRILDARFGTASNLRTAISKVVAGQCTMFPLYVVSFYSYLGILEGKSPRAVLQKVQDSFVPTAITGTCFWPLANIFNFLYVPAAGRMLYINGMGLVWNSFLSWSNTHYGQQKHAAMQQLLRDSDAAAPEEPQHSQHSQASRTAEVSIPTTLPSVSGLVQKAV